MKGLATMHSWHSTMTIARVRKSVFLQSGEHMFTCAWYGAATYSVSGVGLKSWARPAQAKTLAQLASGYTARQRGCCVSLSHILVATVGTRSQVVGVGSWRSRGIFETLRRDAAVFLSHSQGLSD